MKNNIAVPGFLQGTLERLDKMMGQLPDKSHRVCQQQFLSAGQRQTPGGWIQSGKQLVFRQDPRIGQIIQQCGFPGIGIPYDSRHLDVGSLPLSALYLSVILHVF